MSANAKVEFFHISDTHLVFKVRHFVRAWESSFDESAMLDAMIEALKKVKPKHQDIIEKIAKNCC